MGFMTIIIGLQADIIAANRKILQDIQYRIRKMEYDARREGLGDDSEARGGAGRGDGKEERDT